VIKDPEMSVKQIFKVLNILTAYCPDFESTSSNRIQLNEILQSFFFSIHSRVYFSFIFRMKLISFTIVFFVTCVRIGFIFHCC
jgi:hypothetical protein